MKDFAGIKGFIRRWLLLFALIVISVFVIGSVVGGEWDRTAFALELLLTALVICLLQLPINLIPVRIHWLVYVFNFVMVLCTVFLFGWVWHWWYTLADILNIVLSVVPVFAAAIVLDMIIVRRDVDTINKQIKRRRQKLEEEKHI